MSIRTGLAQQGAPDTRRNQGTLQRMADVDDQTWLAEVARYQPATTTGRRPNRTCLCGLICRHRKFKSLCMFSNGKFRWSATGPKLGNIRHLQRNTFWPSCPADIFRTSIHSNITRNPSILRHDELQCINLNSSSDPSCIHAKS